MISCFRFRKLLLPYSEGTLDARRSDAVRKHVSVCGSCAGELAELQSVAAALRGADIPAAEPAADLWARVESAIAEPERRTKPWWQVRNLQMASAAGVAVVMLFAVLAVHLPGPQNDTVSLSKKEAPSVETGQAALSRKPQPEEKAAVSRSKIASVPNRQRMTRSLPASQPKAKASHKSSAERITPVMGAPKTVERLPVVGDAPEAALGPSASTFGLGVESGPKDKVARQVPVSPTPAGRAPYSQITRAPGGSQSPLGDHFAQGRLVEPTRSKAPASAELPAPPAAEALPGPPVGGYAADQRINDLSRGTDVAAAPPSVTGSAFNVGPSVPLMKGAPVRKPNDEGSSAFFKHGDAAYPYRPAAGSSAADELIKANEQALASHPDSLKTMRWLADAYKRRGQVDKQIRMLERVAQLCPIDAQNWLSLGEAYEKVGKKDKAREAYKRALEKGSERIQREAEDHVKRLGS